MKKKAYCDTIILRRFAAEYFFKDVIKMLEYDEYRQTLNGLEKSINDLRDSL